MASRQPHKSRLPAGPYLLLAPCALFHTWACSPIEAPPDKVKAPLVLSASVNNAKPTTSDTITYRVQVDHDQRLNLEIPEFGADIAGLRVVDAGFDQPEKASGRERRNYWYKLRADLSGVYVIPPLAITYKRPPWYTDALTDEAAPASPGAAENAVIDGSSDEPARLITAKTAEIFLEVSSRLGDGTSMQLRDLKPLPKVPGSYLWLYIVCGLAVLAGIIVLLLLWRRRSDHNEPVVPAHEAAYTALAKLLDLQVTDEQSLREFYFRLSSIFRLYLEQRFAINATDLTTEEIGGRLFTISALDEPHRQTAIGLLRGFDGIKFAGRPADAATRTKEVDEVKRFVDDTREVSFVAEEEE